MNSRFALFSKYVKECDRVLDLGCGDGALLRYLQEEKSIVGYGIEISHKGICACIQSGVNVIQHDLNDGLDRFATDSFDVVIMAQTLQAMKNPHLLIKEILRVGKHCIVTFPNFAHWKHRLQLLVSGCMPVTKLLPYEWYDTPNIHLCTFADFEALCAESGICVEAKYILNESYDIDRPIQFMENFFGLYGLYVLKK